MARTTARVNAPKQARATTAAKAARIDEAGLGGRRTGKASATTRAAQARRDAKPAAAAAAAKAGKATTAAKPKAKAVMAAAPAKRSPTTKAAAAKARQARPAPLVEVRTSSSVRGSAGLDAHVESVVGQGLARFAGRLTRVDVYFSDENADKEGGDDKHCRIEARPAARKPVSASAKAATVEKALAGAVGKLKRLLASQFDRKPSRG